MKQIYCISPSITLITDQGRNLIYNWESCDYIEFDDATHPFLQILIQSKKSFTEDQLSEDDIDFLLENNIIFTNNTKRLDNIRQIRQDVYSSDLYITLLPADQSCNFNCLYCYENHDLKYKMNDEHINVFLSFIKNQVSYNHVKNIRISYFGGEPLLNKKFIYEFQKELITLSKELNFNVFATMTTNGYLLDMETVKKLIGLKVVAYQITIDGLQNDHDSLRPLVNGKPTYNKIIDNLLQIKHANIPISIDIRINFNENSASDNKKENVVKQFSNLFKSDTRFKFRCRVIGDYASQNNRDCSKNILYSSDNSIREQFNYEELFYKNNLDLADFTMFSSIGSCSCYAGKDNSYIFSSDYSVKKCTVALDDDINLIGVLQKNGRIEYNDNSLLWSEKNLDNLKIDECNTCYLFFNCQGSSCQLANIKQDRSICPPVKNLEKQLALRIVNKIDKE